MITSQGSKAREHKLAGDAVRSFNLLYLVHRLPYPPDKGDRIRNFHIIRHLSQHANIDLACLADEEVSDQTRKALERYCRRVAIVNQPGWKKWSQAFIYLGRGRTATEGAFHSRSLHCLVRTWGSNTRYDACLASSSAMTPYLQCPELNSTPSVVDLVDVDSQKWLDFAKLSRGLRSRVYQLEGNRLRRLEQNLPSWIRAVTLISEPEADLFRSFATPGSVATITNGVDQDYFRPVTSSAENGCVFVGALDYLPNVDAARWFCQYVWPEIHRHCPDSRLRLVGRQPGLEVQRLGAIPGVDVVGTVPDVRPYLSQAAVVVAPLRLARGVQNKVLEALAMGKPTVASPEALEGLKEPKQLPAIRASTYQEWIDAIIDLLDNAQRRQEAGTKGRQYVEEHYNWDRNLDRLNDLLGIPRPEIAASKGTNGNAPRHSPPAHSGHTGKLPARAIVEK
ncbi:MAG: TIGR03087 family PEP-CTERM/XrtA system glycosyltransferase [Gemmataceae bacterium]